MKVFRFIYSHKIPHPKEKSKFFPFSECFSDFAAYYSRIPKKKEAFL